MQVEGFRVEGWRSLAETDEIPVRSPTILTGANDGGKTASISALGFLLGGRNPATEVRTWAREDDAPDGGVGDDGRHARIAVTGRFSLTDDEMSDFGLPGEVLIRRTSTEGTTPSYEMQAEVPTDERLRSLSSALRLDDLRDRAEALGIAPEGPASAKASFLGPLQRLAEESPKTAAWVELPQGLEGQMPRFVLFSSSREPDPESEIRTILREGYERILDDPKLVGALSEIESDVRTRLQADADALREHIKARMPDLEELSIVPDVSFSGGFQGAALLTSTGEGEHVPMTGIGSGRRRRITLAIWEWATGVLTSAEGPVVIAYDEPDTHLDYSRQRDLVDLVRKQAAGSHVRVVLATHSLNLIDKVDIADVVHLALDEGRTRVHRLPGTGHEEIDEYLAQVADAMGMRNSVLLHERVFLGVEGPTEAAVLPKLFKLVTGHSLQGAGVALVPANGNVGALEFARFLNDQGREVVFMVDADSSRGEGSRKVFRPDRLSAKGIRDDQVFLLGAPGEIEDLFTDDQWCDAANAYWARVDRRDWTPADFTALRADGDGFSKRLVDLVRPASEAAPSAKPGYLSAVVERIGSADEIPEQLVQTLAAVLAAAG